MIEVSVLMEKKKETLVGKNTNEMFFAGLHRNCSKSF